MNQTIIWTALPNGFREDKPGSKTARLSVYVSPRLTISQNAAVTGTLAEFPRFVHWAEHENEFYVEFEGAKPIRASTVIRPEKALWAALFPPTMPVNSYTVRSFSKKQLVSSPMVELAKTLIDNYALAANRFPTAIPKASDWKDNHFFGALVNTPNALRKPLRELGKYFAADLALHGDVNTIQQAIDGIGAGDPSELPDLKQLSLFAQAIHFLRPQTARTNGKLPEARPPDLDFHHLLAALAEYPVILGKLGIVIDLEIDPSTVPLSAKRVRVQVQMDTSDTSDIHSVTPWTLFDTTKFRPATNDNTSGFEFLPIGRPGSPYSLIEVDVHGGAVKVSQTMRDAAYAVNNGNGAKGLPSLRTGGLSVATTDRVTDFQKRALAFDQLQESFGKDTVLSARDLTRGYRVDVFDKSAKQWRSLCQRDGHYGFRDGRYEHSDEGTITAGVTQSADPSASDPRIYIPQTLFRWAGWSLSAPRPGKTVDPAVQNTDAPSVPGLQVAFHVPPGSLPALRFGHDYRVRMRPVDLAGNSLPPETSLDDQQYFLEDRFYRFEPINPPALVPRKPAGLGEAIECMVVRSTPSLPPGEICERVLMPPQTSESIAEQHGMFDGIENAKLVMLPGAWKDMRDNREKSLGFGVNLKQPDPSKSPSKRDIFNSIVPKDENDEPKVTYLPDPAAVGVLLRPVSDSMDPLPPRTGARFGMQPPVNGAPPWPLGPLRFQVKATERDNNTPAYLMPTIHGDLIALDLPKAEVRRYWVSSYSDPDLLKKFAIYNWLESDQRKQAEQGISWMLMPYRELTVVHAVSQPLDPPQFISLRDQQRNANDTFVTLDAEFKVHSKSTGKLEVSAQWSDFTDDPSSNTDPTVGIERISQVKETHVEAGQDDVKLDKVVQSFHDTKHRKVTYAATATTRFREYFPDPAPAGLPFASVSRELDKNGSLVIHSIPSTARPAAPKVLYVIPAFRWSLPLQSVKDFQPTHLESVRQGGGLRVYLDRPWYSSGEGEALGIVVARQSLGTVPPELQKLVTCWGSDPVWPSDQPQNQANQFQRDDAARSFTEVQLDETSQKVDVAVYPVGWDGVRKLWYADLQIDVNITPEGIANGFSYFPFIRLALVRFQADSLLNPDVRASRVVLTDAIQVVPQRKLTLDFDQTGNVTITVSGGQQSLPPISRNRWQVFFETTLDGQPPTGDFDWTRLGDFLGGAGPDGQSLVNITVPLPKPRGSVPMRVVVQESEWYNSPDWIQDDQVGGTGARVVYADAIEF